MVAVPTLGGGIVAPSRRKPCPCVSDRPSLVAASSAHTSSGLLDYVPPTRAAITCRDGRCPTPASQYAHSASPSPSLRRQIRIRILDHRPARARIRHSPPLIGVSPQA